MLLSFLGILLLASIRSLFVHDEEDPMLLAESAHSITLDKRVFKAASASSAATFLSLMEKRVKEEEAEKKRLQKEAEEKERRRRKKTANDGVDDTHPPIDFEKWFAEHPDAVRSGDSDDEEEEKNDKEQPKQEHTQQQPMKLTRSQLFWGKWREFIISAIVVSLFTSMSCCLWRV